MFSGLGTKDRKLILLVGAPRSGKSTFAAQLCNAANSLGQTALIYNASPRSDNFARAVEIELLSSKDLSRILGKTKSKAAAEIDDTYYKYQNKIYHLKNILALFCGKTIKAQRLYNDEDIFFNTIKNYISNSLLVIDDAKEVLRYGLSSELISILSKINHTGANLKNPLWRGKGCDVVLVVHSLQDINPIIWSYATDLIMFRSDYKINFLESLCDESRAKAGENIYNALQQSEKYTFGHVELIKTN